MKKANTQVERNRLQVVVRYSSTKTEFDFIEKINTDALLGLISMVAIKEGAAHFPGNDMSAPALYVRSDVIDGNTSDEYRRFLLSFHKRRLSPDDQRMPMIYMKQQDVWKYVGPLSLTLNNTLNQIAKKCDWERAVFIDDNGHPTDTPSISVRESRLGLYFYIPMAKISRMEFRNICKLSKSK